jgi:hypothetical protein
MTMLKSFLFISTILIATSVSVIAQATVSVKTADLQGPRALQEQTKTAAIRDYLRSWQVLGAALEQNRADLLDPTFVGTAKDTLTETIHQQAALGIRMRYRDRAHDLQIVFYSPEGMSIELFDTVDYDLEVLDHERVKTIQHLSARYVIVLTPAEVSWRVRVFQGIAR